VRVGSWSCDWGIGRIQPKGRIFIGSHSLPPLSGRPNQSFNLAHVLSSCLVSQSLFIPLLSLSIYIVEGFMWSYTGKV
jgi:hypothetical protein